MNTTKKITHILTAGLAFLAGFALEKHDARADYTLADGESKTFASASDFGTLSQNITGPTAEGSMATLNFTNSAEIRILTGAISGNITLVKTGAGAIRFNHTYSSSVTPFSGPVTISEGRIYLTSGQELGTGTITLGNTDTSKYASLQNNETNIDISNNIIVVGTAYFRPYQRDKVMKLRGDITGDGNIVYGYNGTTREWDNSTVEFYGNNTYTGSTSIEHGNNGSTSYVYKFNVYGENGFGTGALEVKNLAQITYQNSETETKIDRNITHTSLAVSNGKTLTLKNEGDGKVNISTRWLTSNVDKSTVDLSGSNIHLTLAGKANETLKGTIKIASGSSLAFTGEKDQSTHINMSISGAGTLKIADATSMIRMNRDNPNFSGDISITAGRLYVNTGKELGTGTIYLGSTEAGKYASLQNNNTNIELVNDIVLTGTAYLRPYSYSKTAKFRGDFTGTGNLIYGFNGFTLESDNATVNLYGNNTYTGYTSVEQGGNNAYRFNVYGENGFGTGALEVKNNTQITFQNAESGDAVNRKMTNSAINVATGKTLTLQNGGAGETTISGTLTNAGTTKIENGNFSLANSVTNNGKITLGKDATLGVGAYDSTTGYDLNVTGTGNIQLNGDLMISAFSPTDYDTITFTNTQNVTLGNDFTLVLALPNDSSEFNHRMNTLDVFSGLNDLTLFQDADLYFSQSGWYGYINGNGQVVFGDSNALPEPATWALLALATLGIGYLRKR